MSIGSGRPRRPPRHIDDPPITAADFVLGPAEQAVLPPSGISLGSTQAWAFANLVADYILRADSPLHRFKVLAHRGTAMVSRAAIQPAK